MTSFLVQNHDIAIRVDREDENPLVLVRATHSALASARRSAREQLVELGVDKSKFRFTKGEEGSHTSEHCFNGETLEPCWVLPIKYKGRWIDFKKLKLTTVLEW